jgi:hypothetical protein
MGLDQYAFIVPPVSEHEVIEEDKNHEDIAYWRKHNRLQGWMENLYRIKGGKETFNCVDLELTLEDLDKLEEDVKSFNLPQTGGFFFGDDSYSYDDKEEQVIKDLEFINTARNSIIEGNKVFYSSWW